MLRDEQGRAVSVLVPAIIVCDNRECRLGEGGQPKQENIMLKRHAVVEGTWFYLPPLKAGTWRVVLAGRNACGDACEAAILADTPVITGGQRT